MKTKPYNRHETFLAALSDSDISVPTPYSREELYLAKIAGEDVTIPTASYNRYETYLAKIAGEDVSVPTPVSRLEYYLYKACGNSCDVPVPANREEVFWKRYVGEEVSGSSITITDALAGNVRSAVISIEGSQAGAGTPSTENVRPITAYDNAVITVADGNGDAQETYTISFGLPNPVYLGELDVTAGKLKRSWESITYDGTETWGNMNNGKTNYLFRNIVSGKSCKVGTAYRTCSHYENKEVNNSTTGTGFYVYNSSGNIFIQIRPDNLENTTTKDEWLSYLEGRAAADEPVQVAWRYSDTECETVFDLTPTDIVLSSGANTVTCNCGTITIKYTPDL